MSDAISRRQLIRNAAGAAALTRLGTGCARRIDVPRQIQIACPAAAQLSIAAGMAPELSRAGGAVLVQVNGLDRTLLVANAGSGLIAVDGLCTHERCPLSWVEEDRQVECACHGSRFASDGSVLNPPAIAPLASYAAALDGSGNVVVDLAPGDGVFPPLQNGTLVVDLTAYPALLTSGGAVLGYAEGHPGPIVLARLAAGGIVAFDGTCTHLACTVHPARSGVLHCPCHGSTFSISPDLSNPQALQPAPGFVLTGPAGTALHTFPVSLSADGKTATVTFPPACP